ncbi:PREDICTED: uncharacterized protein LOC108779784 [Cyphomyrmex costatus]|uniref:uncharacterized protein LOC108779784 n=1 Tax=Cyphomyrmex costatus TaxID=456900 RepID=UPI0008524083|nr:PREDICTED: uncharacterized protein LOC108779784 [Cyphomyrmex costatus]
MDSISLTEAKTKRTAAKASLTRHKSAIESFDANHGSRHDIIERKKRILELWNLFDVVQSRIEVLENEEDLSSQDLDLLNAQHEQHRASFESTYFSVISRCESLLEHFDQHNIRLSSGSFSTPGANSSARREAHVKLPKIELPVFSGSYEDWYSYHDMFEQLIHNNQNLSEIEKFHYLRSSLKDKAAEIIKSIETTTDNYKDAWNAIKERFDNKRWILQRHIKAIFEIAPVTKENHAQLRELLDTILKHLRALKAMGRPTDTWDDLIVHLIISKLDTVTTKAWETSIPDMEIPTLKSLTDFLSKRCIALEAISSKSSINQFAKAKNCSVSNLATSNLSCPKCKENHPLYYCETFLKLPVESRIAFAKKVHLCLNCLRSNSHQAKNCTSSSCRKCKGQHNTLLHLSKTTDANESSNAKTAVTSDTEISAKPVATQCLSTYQSLGIILSTAIIHVFDCNNHIHSCRVLLDSGSQMNFITQSLADKLYLNKRQIEISISGVTNANIRANQATVVHIKSRFNNFSERIECVVLPKITQQLPQKFISKQNITIPNNLKLADPDFNVPADIDMLIGAEIFWKLICAGQIKPSRNKPTLQKTLLGWILSGPTSSIPSNSSSSIISCLAVTEDLNHALSRFWELDHSISASTLSPEHQSCENLFKDTVKRNSDGRFVVQLPIIPNKLSELGESREIATRRFKCLEKRFVTSPKLHAEYKEFIQEYIQLGHMREVTHITNNDSQTYYLPHHAVYKETSTSTKLRVVFDGSCKTTTGISLNDALLVGPTIQDDLLSILIRFRMYRYVMTADVAKMYRQVLIDPNQTSLQRILWRDSSDQPIQTFELLTVTYGTASAAFLAIRSLRKLAEDNSEKYPVGSGTVLNDFYVDDLVTGADNLQDASSIKIQTRQLLLEGGFELRKWFSNVPDLQDDQLSNPEKEFVLSSDKECETRTLGLVWNCTHDHFQFSSISCLPPLATPTKRQVLSRVALVFDPLGLFGPATVIAKIIIQQLWLLKIGWDEALPLDSTTKWKRYERELPILRDMTISRRAIALSEHINLELHGFSDASERAYGACIYLRATDAHGNISIRLLCSKNRVAPLKSLSIPRLELCAALLLAQITDKILKRITHKFTSIYLWTDSTVVLAWLQSSSRTWSTFVSNRVGDIQQLTTIQDWHHVSSQDNPADLLSRGISPAALPHAHLWWSGPAWLKLDKGQWPQFPFTINKRDIPEYKSSAITSATATLPYFDIFERFSSFMKLVRIAAYIFRFFNKLKQRIKPDQELQSANNKTLVITPDETDHAIKILLKIVQRLHFPKELDSLSRQQNLNKNSPIVRLNPFIDAAGILRVGGRLKLSHLPYNAKYPALLPGNHPFSRLIIIHEHEKHFHAGPHATLSAVRQNYWLIAARDVVRQITRKCIVCFRSSPKMASTLMGNLPESRITIPERPFENCGVDYAGPLYYKEGLRKTSKLLKCYIAIFVCFASTAVHIELATDLSTKAFLNVLKRFISRRGCPTIIHSDNGLNFKGAQRELNELAALFKNQESHQQIINYVSSKGIRWRFIPPRAPHHGGLWEAAVKGAKRHLYRVTREAHLRYEELETLVIQIEAILNSRPLTPVSSDVADLTPLTPGHFVIGAPLTSYPEPSLERIPITRLSRWQRVEQIRQHFWQRWSKEYLHYCQQRNKWTIKENPLHIGQMVLLREDSASPLSWPLARIVELHPGNDNIVRTVTIRTSSGIYKRPITRLCVLPFDSN